MSKEKDWYKQTLEEEAKTWLIDDEAVRNEKMQRETVRYPLIAKQMGLNALDTSNMVIFDIGASITLGVSSILPSKKTYRIDPLAGEYAKYQDVTSFLKNKEDDYIKAEDSLSVLNEADLIIITNALDHFENPHGFMSQLPKAMKSGAYFAHFHAINNAITHPHPAHKHNVNPEMFEKYLSEDMETVWYMDKQNDNLTYGWRKQPAFAGLYRKVTGYGGK